MRYILIILVFLSVGANAQMVIKAHANYRPYASPAANLLLDDYPNAAAAYSLRKLDKDYSGSAIRVRKDTTGQPEQDIGFTASGDLDTAQLKQFLNLRSGFITTWYDQSGNARNATQSTAANQPRIANLGVIDRQNTKPTVRFDGSNDILQGDGAASSISGEDVSWSVLSVVTKSDLSGFESTYGFGNSSDNDPIILPISYADATYRIFLRSPTNLPIDTRVGTVNTNNQTLLSNYSNGFSYNFYVNNSLLSNVAYNFTTININTATIGGLRRISISDYINGNIQELIFYNSNQSSNRTGIESNINTHYGIY